MTETIKTVAIRFTESQAEIVRDFYEDWLSYYSDESILDHDNMNADDRTEEEARVEIANAKASSMDGNVLTIVAGSALHDDICHELEMLVSDFRADPKERRAAKSALAKLEL